MNDHDILISLKSEVNQLDFKVKNLDECMCTMQAMINKQERQLGSCDIVKLENNIELLSIMLNNAMTLRQAKEKKDEQEEKVWAK